jgi:hypothetical protein
MLDLLDYRRRVAEMYRVVRDFPIPVGEMIWQT